MTFGVKLLKSMNLTWSSLSQSANSVQTHTIEEDTWCSSLSGLIYDSVPLGPVSCADFSQKSKVTDKCNKKYCTCYAQKRSCSYDWLHCNHMLK